MRGEKTKTLSNTPALLVANTSPITSTQTENSAPLPAIDREVRLMGYEFYDALTKYKSAMEQAKAMLNKGLITIEEYAIIDTNMCGRFGVDLDSLYRDNDLIITDMYGNIAPKKGVI